MKVKTSDITHLLLKLKVRGFTRLSLFIVIVCFSEIITAQNKSYTQLGNELQFAHAINNKFAAELFLGGTFSNTSSEPRVLSTNIQRYVAGWAHYYYSPRWKFSSSLAYYYNKDVPDIGQYFSPEWRLSLQGMYYIHKTGYILVSRMRGEIRIMMNEEGAYEDKYRYRQMIKYTKPLNGKVLRKGIVYLAASEELFFKPDAKSTGVTFFDRNRFELGGGYMVTDDFQVELTYVNEFVPRDNGNEIYNIVSLTVTFNNLLSHIKERFGSQDAATVSEE